MWYRVDMRTISLRQFRDSIADIDEPVVVQRRDPSGDFVTLGLWQPAGPVALEAGERYRIGPDGVVLHADRLIGVVPTSRSAPEIPSGEYPAVGTAETDRAQSGTSDEVPSAATVKEGLSSQARLAPASHEPEGESLHSPSSGSSLSTDAEALGWPGGGNHEPLLPRSIIPPKPAGYVHDPHFNSKGSRPAPKTGGRK